MDPTDMEERIICPCNGCKHQIIRKRRVCLAHVRKYGTFPIETLQRATYQSYVKNDQDNLPVLGDIAPTTSKAKRKRSIVNEDSTPSHHEETSVPDTMEENTMEEMLNAFFELDSDMSEDEATGSQHVDEPNQPRVDRHQQEGTQQEATMRKLARLPLYEGARISVLRTSLALLNLQSIFGWSDTSVTELFKLLKDQILPVGNHMPLSRPDGKALLTSMGMDYQRIHACRNDCILFRKEYEQLQECPHCNSKRYREDVLGEAIPVKVLRHFPIIPRIRSMFRSKSIAELMTWHHSSRSTDDVLRVPADSQAWKHIEETWPAFKEEPRNVHFGLAMDGVNPFGLRSSSWSTWPVCLVNYNLPPWLAIKKGHLLLSLIVPGKHKVKNMDIYLAPLIEELNTLWNGISVLDMSRPAGQRATVVKGILMWTMHDWPGYGECSGLATSGFNACSLCGPRLDARHSKNLKKVLYEGHVRYLPEGHVLRNGNLARPLLKSLKASDWKLTWQQNNSAPCMGMKRLSIFHSLPYWGDLIVNHLLDPMHIFKNVGELLWKTISGQTESKGQRDELQVLGRMPALWARPKSNGKHVLPKAPWVLSKDEEIQVKRTIAEFRTPTGCMHCLKGAFTRDDKLSGLKSHDWHKFLQFVLPVAIKGCLSEDIRATIYKISSVVRWISSKEIRKDSVEAARRNSIEAVCMVEKFFPPNLLTIQMHLLVHIVDEVAVAGIVHCRWMFFLERFMKTLKGFVRQKARPEGSMAEGWLVQESLVFITEYLSAVDPEMPKLWSNDANIRVIGEEPQGKGIIRKMDDTLRAKINKFCILNSESMERWLEEYKVAKKERLQERTEF